MEIWIAQCPWCRHPYPAPRAHPDGSQIACPKCGAAGPAAATPFEAANVWSIEGRADRTPFFHMMVSEDGGATWKDGCVSYVPQTPEDCLTRLRLNLAEQDRLRAKETDAVCSFCGRGGDEAKNLVVKDGIAICEECNETCRKLFAKPKGDWR